MNKKNILLIFIISIIVWVSYFVHAFAVDAEINLNSSSITLDIYNTNNTIKGYDLNITLLEVFKLEYNYTGNNDSNNTHDYEDYLLLPINIPLKAKFNIFISKGWVIKCKMPFSDINPFRDNVTVNIPNNYTPLGWTIEEIGDNSCARALCVL